ncbi:MAG: MazG nucleotide pyrophosphohydrolase domain-containing protein [Acidobacteriota bacterium]
MSEHGSEAGRASEALDRLDAITRQLRVECPWDRTQDERSIVPHTVEEAYELADAVSSGDDEKLLDELGDVLFQVYFLALLLEERGEGDLGVIAGQLTDKLIRRHPHVYPPQEQGDQGQVDQGQVDQGQAEPEGESGVSQSVPDREGPAESGGSAKPVETADDVRRQWDRIKRDVEGRTSEGDRRKPGLPSLIYANKVQWKLDPSERPANAGARNPDLEADQARIGRILWEAVAEARRAGVDPELALRSEAERRAPDSGHPQ